ncbi:MAG: DUF2229 domain-containing protein [Sporanaerobacter sp.]|jgi:predicted nucleotide-binding protein (sugar kinase/HSP70/actin superfamily)|uniref:acyl-CoA dehydratase activase-related protein n=1 Tax=Sporanaerobacter sp. TaxID=2010183 RepID=UPI003A102D4E
MCKIGIPRGMLFYDYYPLWAEFFEELGAKVVVSPKSNKEILNSGVLSCVDECCLPVKVFHGHVDYLKDKVDYIFIPKIISIRKMEYCCPKILGLPDMVKFSIEDLPPIIDTNINLRKNSYTSSKYKKAVYEAGKCVIKNSSKIRNAYKKAEESYQRYLYLLSKGVIPIEAIKMYNKTFVDLNYNSKKHDMSIMVVGHPYNIYDEYLNMNIISKLINKGIKVMTPEMVNKDEIIYYSAQLPKRMFWTYGRRIVGSAFSLIERDEVDGIIYLSSFGCGIDSILIDLIERKAKNKGIPFTLLTLDEQTGEAGIDTRVEAFIDMMKWRDKDDFNISTLR